MSKLPYSTRDADYDNAKFRQRSHFKVITQSVTNSSIGIFCVNCSLGKLLMLLLISGVTCLFLMNKSSPNFESNLVLNSTFTEATEAVYQRPPRLWRRPPRLPPRLTPDEMNKKGSSLDHRKWVSRQHKVKEAFIHAWSGYKNFAMGFDELMPLSKRGTDGLGGLGATIIDALDTAMIMGENDIVKEASTWIEENLVSRINEKGQVNLFETTIRVLGGLLSAYHLSTLGNNSTNPEMLLEVSKVLADRLLLAFSSSSTPIPFSDVYLRDKIARPAPDGLSSTSEASTLQLEFNYLSEISGDPKYYSAGMKVLEHMRSLPKVEGLVPIYISPHSGQFSGENIRLGSRGDSYYEYLIKIWIQQKNRRDTDLKYLYEMYTEAMRGVRHRLVRKSVPKGLVFVGELPDGSQGGFSPKMDHLVCFLPGTLALGATKGMTKTKAMESNLLSNDDIENLKLAEDLAKTCFEMYAVTSTGLAPEIAYFRIEGEADNGPDGGNRSSEYINDIIIKYLDRHNLLRPETVESLMYLHRITEDPKYREWGWQIFEAFEKYTKIESGGYTSLDDVTSIPPPKRDKMETFFLGETLKYFYLLFGENDVLPLDKYVFNTEAHPLPVIGLVDEV
ncbi:mannosyl-oligosaccharide 1,2-alpha-mannosidase MNS3 [Carex littledalei]|uniref:alpha-1,2-Mannosidase n=1 Tax=Carex littledalei TaxID=544730 RepID=A0A833QYA3_9POAL|nr:mannosyl-oligosaccharide 1,2-alpha-mannosidase MNS3 [Carex littledalei]